LPDFSEFAGYRSMEFLSIIEFAPGLLPGISALRLEANAIT
jgi:hypothetical protein